MRSMLVYRPNTSRPILVQLAGHSYRLVELVFAEALETFWIELGVRLNEGTKSLIGILS